MATENYINLYFDDEKKRLTVLTNICRMLVTRGYMDKNKYSSKNSNEKKESIVESPSNDHLDNSLFLPFIQTRSDNNIYEITLDTPYRTSRDESTNSNYDGSKIYVKLIPQIIKDVNHSQMLDDFIKSYENFHKIVVFDSIADKVYMALRKKKNLELFEMDDLMIDLMSHVCAPISCEFVNLKDINYITNPKFETIHENDPIVKYNNGHKGDIMRILRQSLNNSVDVVYKRVISAAYRK